MKHFFTRVSAVLGMLFTLAPIAAHADGLFVPAPDVWVHETNQEAVVFFEDGREDLIVSSGFKGDATNFAWIIPTPSQPTVERGSWELFSGLREITQNGVTDLRLGGVQQGFSASDYITESEVQEIERQSIAYYDVAVLEARTTDGLMQWFADNGFTYPEDQRYILDDYINAGWYFTAVKLNTDALSLQTAQAIKTGSTIPLHLSFAAERMVFPLQLSQVTAEYDSGEKRYPAPKSVGITLYVIADHKQSLPDFTQGYAGYISAKAVSELSFTTDGKPMLLGGDTAERGTDKTYVLTRLYRYFPISEMTYDLYPREEENTGVLNASGNIANTMLGFWLMVGIGAGVALVLVIVAVRMNKHTNVHD